MLKNGGRKNILEQRKEYLDKAESIKIQSERNFHNFRKKKCFCKMGVFHCFHRNWLKNCIFDCFRLFFFVFF